MALNVQDNKSILPIDIAAAGKVTKEVQTAGTYVDKDIKIEVNTPDEYIGDIVGNLNRKRAKVESMRRYRKGSQKITALVPLMEMFAYTTQLRNISSGRANYSMEFYNYSALPSGVQEEVLKKIKEN